MIWLRGIWQERLDLRLRPTGGLEARVVDRPSAWMSDAEVDRLVSDVRAIAQATLPGGALNYGVLGGDRDRLCDSVLTIVYDRETARPIAFNALV
jgi:hypothetical protein